MTFMRCKHQLKRPVPSQTATKHRHQASGGMWKERREQGEEKGGGGEGKGRWGERGREGGREGERTGERGGQERGEGMERRRGGEGPRGHTAPGQGRRRP